MWDLDAIMDFVCEYLGVNKDDVKGPSRLGKLVKARVLFAYGCEEASIHIKDYSAYLNRDRTTGIHYREYARWNARRDKDFKIVHTFINNPSFVPEFPDKIFKILRKYLVNEQKITNIAIEIINAYEADRHDQAPILAG